MRSQKAKATVRAKLFRARKSIDISMPLEAKLAQAGRACGSDNALLQTIPHVRA